MASSSSRSSSSSSTQRQPQPHQNSFNPEYSCSPGPDDSTDSPEHRELWERVDSHFGGKLRPGQRKVFTLLLEGKDVVLRAPTGWGKSRIFQGFRLLFGTKERPVPKVGITIILTPLKGLAQSQVSELNDPKMKGGQAATAIFLSGDSTFKDLRDTANGVYYIVYISPEKANNADVNRLLWHNTDFRSKVILIAVDEAHLVEEWGKDFRPAYRKLGLIRDVFGNKPPWFVTSATLPNTQREDVLASLGIKDANLVDEDLNRPNLYYNLIVNNVGEKFRGGGTTPLDHIANVDIADGIPQLKKTIIYFDSVETLGAMMDHLREILFQAGASEGQMYRFIQGYYANRTTEAKDKVYSEFKSGECMIVLATEAFGMGMDVPDIERVYLWGTSRSMSSLIQRCGRGARGHGREAICTIIISKEVAKIERKLHPDLAQSQKERGVVDDMASQGEYPLLGIRSQPDTQNDMQRDQGNSRTNNKKRKKKVEANKSGEEKVPAEGPYLQNFKKRCPDLYEFLQSYCLRHGIMEYLSGTNVEYEACSEGSCCSLCSSVQLQNSGDVSGFGPCGLIGLASKDIPLPPAAKKKYASMLLRAEVEKKLLVWREEVFDYFAGDDDLIRYEFIAPDEVLAVLAKNSNYIAGGKPVPEIKRWAGYYYYEMPNNKLDDVIKREYESARGRKKEKDDALKALKAAEKRKQAEARKANNLPQTRRGGTEDNDITSFASYLLFSQ